MYALGDGFIHPIMKKQDGAKSSSRRKMRSRGDYTAARNSCLASPGISDSESRTLSSAEREPLRCRLPPTPYASALPEGSCTSFETACGDEQSSSDAMGSCSVSLVSSASLHRRAVLRVQSTLRYVY